MILAKLKMKGFSPEILQQIKEDFTDPEMEEEAIQQGLNFREEHGWLEEPSA